jgi:hypothetical protein
MKPVTVAAPSHNADARMIGAAAAAGLQDIRVGVPEKY